MPTGGREPKRKKPSAPLDGGGGGAGKPGGAPRGRSPAMAPDLTVADADALDCGVCFLPLKPPIFQCDVGHVLCSPCSDKLKGAGKCHVCGVATPAGGYRRCHAMERLVDALRAACPNAPYGCASTPPYHGREEHILACPHAPCHCPGKACGFVGSTAALRVHFRSAHGWPCHTEPYAGAGFQVCLCDGFNLVVSTKGDDLFLLNVARHPFCRTVSAVCIRPPRGGAAERKRMELSISYDASKSGSNQRLLVSYEQKARFQVAYSDLSDGLPDSNDCHQLILPKYVHGDNDGIKVTVHTFPTKESADR